MRNLTLQKNSSSYCFQKSVSKETTQKHQAELKIKIQSEKQRMERDQEIQVPYHRPKQYGLKEFLARRSIKKPSAEKTKDEKPISCMMALKKISENIEQFAQKMKEREDEAIEFFRSESESDDENDPIDDKINTPTNVITDTSTVQENSDCETKPELGMNETPQPSVQNDEEQGKTESVSLLGTSEELKSPSKDAENLVVEQSKTSELEHDMEAFSATVVESEDKELNALREKYKNLPEPDDVDDVKPQISHFTLKTLNSMSLNNDVIDLETGFIEPRTKSGPEMLYERYLKTIQKAKPKDHVSMNILTIENGKLENKKVQVKLTKDVEIDHDRPGLSHERLKQNLFNQIKDKRLEELKIKFLETDKKKSCVESKDDSCDDEAEEEESEPETREEDTVSDEEEEEKKVKKTSCAFLDPEVKYFVIQYFRLALKRFFFQAVDEDEDEDESSDEEVSTSEDEEVKETSAAPRKSRILKAFEDSDNEEIEKEDVVEEAAMETEIFDEPFSLEIPQSDTILSPEHPLDPDNVKRSTPVLREPFATQCSYEDKNSDEMFNTQQCKFNLNEKVFCLLINFLSFRVADFTFTEPSVSEEIKTTGIEFLCDPDASQVVDDELLDICSGQFAPTQIASQLEVSQVDGQPEETQSNSQPEESQTNGQPDPFSYSQFNSTVEEVVVEEKAPEKDRRKLLDSSDDEGDASGQQKVRKKKKTRKQKLKKLDFSDDEDKEASTPQQDDENSGDFEECEEEEQEVDLLVDYDSEENEIEVKMNKKDRIEAAGAYFDEEADLSESEWGSADEDEKDLDKFDIELGDEDEFDQNKLQEEVGRIHARKILDDDIRNVKRIEELLFENEENDGIGRDRKFRWKNQTKDFTLDDENARDGDLLEEGEFDEESEISWRKMRHERETMLSEQSQKMTESETMNEDILLLDPNSQTVTCSSNSMVSKRKFHIIKTSSSVGISPSVISAKKESPFLIKTSSLKKFNHSSFLSRDEKTLSKIARFVSHKDDEVTNLSSHGSNSMSFMTIEKKPEENKKRKSDGNNQPKELVKRRKVETSSKKLLLDQLE